MASYQAPRNQIEQAIAKSWQETLGIKPIGINDNFFELGGDSLTAVQIISNLRASLQISISLQSFLNTSTTAKSFSKNGSCVSPISVLQVQNDKT